MSDITWSNNLFNSDLAIATNNVLNNTSSLKNDDVLSLQKFLTVLDNKGTAIKCRYDAHFENIPDLTLYLTNISTPAINRNFTDVYYEGKKVELPINFEYSHSFSMTVICDNKGTFYKAAIDLMKNLNDNESSAVNTGYDIKIFSHSDSNLNNKTEVGFTIVLKGVRFKTISGLDFNPTGTEFQTFNIDSTCVSFELY